MKSNQCCTNSNKANKVAEIKNRKALQHCLFSTYDSRQPSFLTRPSPLSSLQSAEPSCAKSPTSRPPPRVQPGPGLSSRAEDPAPPRPSLLEPRWRPAESITSPCRSCCPWPLCCYLCCSPAPSPYVSVRTQGSCAAAPGDLGGLTFISDIWKYLQGSGERKVENAAESFFPLTATPQLLAF